MKIKINIPRFGKKFCSNNVEFKIYYNLYYNFYKKRTNIRHNEYGPAFESKNGSHSYLINNEFHRLTDCAYYYSKYGYTSYYVIGTYLGHNKEAFIKNLANTLIPKRIPFLF